MCLLTRLLSNLQKPELQKVKLTKDDIEDMFPRVNELLSFHRKLLDRILLWTPKKDTLVDVFEHIDD